MGSTGGRERGDPIQPHERQRGGSQPEEPGDCRQRPVTSERPGDLLLHRVETGEAIVDSPQFLGADDGPLLFDTAERESSPQAVTRSKIPAGEREIRGCRGPLDAAARPQPAEYGHPGHRPISEVVG